MNIKDQQKQRGACDIPDDWRQSKPEETDVYNGANQRSSQITNTCPYLPKKGNVCSKGETPQGYPP